MECYQCWVVRLPVLQGHVARASGMLTTGQFDKVNDVAQSWLGSDRPQIGENTRLRVVPVVPVCTNLTKEGKQWEIHIKDVSPSILMAILKIIFYIGTSPEI